MGTLNLGASGTVSATSSLSLGVVPCFSARAGGSTPFQTDGTPLPFTNVDVNRGGCYSTGDGKFTCTLAGVYKFDVSLISGGTNHWFRGDIKYQSGGSGTASTIAKSQSDYGGSGSLDYTHCGFSIIYPCAVGDKVWVVLDTTQGGTSSVFTGESGKYSQWNGMFVSA